MQKSLRENFYIITILFFVMGFLNIIFAGLGFACLLLPFVFIARDKRKTWCQQYCPRAGLFGVLFRNRSLTGKAGPGWLIRGEAKWILYIYFIFNLFVLTMSTVMVSIGRIEPIKKVRFVIMFEIPWDLPQLMNIGPVPAWAMHLSYRIYSMMFTTMILGLLLAWIFRPRTWCTVCPINTMSDLALRKIRR